MKKIYSILMVAVAALSMSFSANAEAPKWEIVAGLQFTYRLPCRYSHNHWYSQCE